MKKLIYLVLAALQISVSFAQYCPSEAAQSEDSKCDLVQLIGDSQDINNNTTSSGCETYSDFTSLVPANISVAQNYVVTVIQGTCGDPYNRYANAWIDFNNDDDFDDAGEALSTGNSSSSTDGFVHTFSFTVPAGASIGTTQLRVIVKEGGAATDPCAMYQWGETEDYLVSIVASNIPPVTDFVANTTSSCNGIISFTDLSTGNPTSWLWDFGDGNTSTQQNPTHTYSTNGTFTVQLTTTNAFGSDTETFTNYVTINATGGAPIAANCSPQTLSPSAGFGISNVQFGTINNNSGDGTNGLEDFTCNSTTLLTGVSYPISITTDTPQPHNVRAWIDYNNDGSFSNSSELVLSEDASLISQGNVFIPAAVILNTPLRMRVMADWYLQPAPDGCSDVQNGQAEDYTVIIEPNTNPPVAEFNADPTLSCTGEVSFFDLSTNVPTQWEWDFGDGNSSAQQNPIHNFDTSGVYTISLIVENAFGVDTMTYTDYIEVNYMGMVNTPSCTPTTSSYCCGYGIYRVNFIDINKSSDGGADGYQDYSCTDNTIADKGSCYPIEIITGTQNAEDVKVWIDLNNDSNFDASELVLESFNSYVHTGIIEIPSTGIVADTAIIMRVMSESIGNTIDPCTNLLFGQTEDYAIFINDINPIPTVFFTADVTTSCDGVINFSDEACGSATSWLWDFGDGNTSTLQNPTHTYTAPGIYDVSLQASNANGSNSDTLFQYIEVVSLFGEPISPSCEPETLTPFDDLGINHVVFNDINKWSSSGIDGYQDFSCTDQTVVDPGNTYNFFAETSAQFEEDVYVWIDYNNNGTFQGSEQVFDSQFVLQNHGGTITIPTSGMTYGVPLRMRVWSDFSQGFAFSDPCFQPEYGQVEDYAIIIQDPTAAPIANFTADSTQMCAGTVQFTNLSSSSASSFSWQFGDGGTSTLENPNYTYSSPGFYDVTLTVSNSNGSNTLTMSNFIEYLSDCSIIGVEEISLDEAITIYPNPSDGLFTVIYSNQTSLPVVISISDVLGRRVYNNEFTGVDITENINLSQNEPGIYFIRIAQGTNAITKRITIK